MKLKVLSNQSIPEEERRDIAFQIVVAAREAYTLAAATGVAKSYEFAFEVIRSMDSNLYDTIIELLSGKNESDLVKYFKDKADALSQEENIITPESLILTEIRETQELLRKSESKHPQLTRRIIQLTSAKEFFLPRKQSENKSLNHDFYLRERYERFKNVNDTDTYKDFRINKDKILRLRLAHPDNDEAVLGVDLIYENYDMRNERVRFAHLQYKTWIKGVLYLSQSKNLEAQLGKMKFHLCDSGYCKGPEDPGRDYRLPYCCGFLRPTSKLQNAKSKLVTTGVHIPICIAQKLLDEHKMITKTTAESKSVMGHIFEELFVSGIIGSRWINLEEYDSFYEEKKLASHTNTIRLYAQEVTFERTSLTDSPGEISENN